MKKSCIFRVLCAMLLALGATTAQAISPLSDDVLSYITMELDDQDGEFAQVSEVNIYHATSNYTGNAFDNMLQISNFFGYGYSVLMNVNWDTGDCQIHARAIYEDNYGYLYCFVPEWAIGTPYNQLGTSAYVVNAKFDFTNMTIKTTEKWALVYYDEWDNNSYAGVEFQGLTTTLQMHNAMMRHVLVNQSDGSDVTETYPVIAKLDEDEDGHYVGIYNFDRLNVMAAFYLNDTCTTITNPNQQMASQKVNNVMNYFRLYNYDFANPRVIPSDQPFTGRVTDRNYLDWDGWILADPTTRNYWDRYRSGKVLLGFDLPQTLYRMLTQAQDGDEYTISNDLAVVASNDEFQHVYCVDEHGNWVRLVVSSPRQYLNLISSAGIKGWTLTGNVTGVTTNPEFAVTSTPTTLDNTDFDTQPRIFDLSDDEMPYDPRPDEVHYVRGIYDAASNRLCAAAGGRGRGVEIDLAYIANGDMLDGRTYTLYGVTQLIEPWSAPKRISSDDPNAYLNYSFMPFEISIPTEIITPEVKTQVTGKRYYTIAGAEIPAPQSGINIEVTTYDDGTTSTSKVVR